MHAIINMQQQCNKEVVVVLRMEGGGGDGEDIK